MRDFNLARVLLPALEQAIDAMVIVDADEAITFFNAAAERLWGCDRAEVLGRHVACLMPLDVTDPLSHLATFGQLDETAPSMATSRELRLERKDGSQIWCDLSLSKVMAEGETHHIMIARDISAQVRQREEQALRALAVDQTDRGVLVLDAQNRIVDANPAFTRIFGYSSAEAMGHQPAELLLSVHTDPMALDQLRIMATKGEPFRTEIRARTKRGDDIWTSVAISSIFDPDGTLRHTVGLLSDITERRQIEAFQRAILEAIASNHPLADIMDLLCRRVEAIAPDLISSIVAVDAGGRIRPIAGPRLPEAYREAIQDTAFGEGRGCCGAAAARGAPVLSQDIGTDPLWKDCKQLALSLGLRACWSSPIVMRDGRVAGTLAFFYKEPRSPSLFHQRIVDACLHLCVVAMEREESRAQIARLAHFDGLTGLSNRTHTYQRIEGFIREDGLDSSAIFLIDLDHFKDTNDALGHATGDKVLVEVANRLEEMWGQRGMVGRTDGDTFALVARRCAVEQAPLLVDEILGALRQPFHIDGHVIAVNVSIGISLCPMNGTDGRTLIRNADIALHRAKVSGRARVTFFSPEMNQVVEERLLLATRLRAAVANGELKLRYQPQIETGSRRLHGVEALAHWTDGELGLVSPSKFIPLAEEIGQIGEIGRWSLREACRQIADWRRDGLTVPSVSVNVSAKHFRTDELPSLIAGLLAEFELSPQSLIIEITETAMMDADPGTFATIEKIRALGVRLSMDDFGTGFSSLARLARLPVSELKIDRDFMQGFEKDGAKKAVTTAAIRTGQSLGLTVVAEGVETEEQRDLLNALGCDILQGYLIAHPLPPEELAAWINGR